MRIITIMSQESSLVKSSKNLMFSSRNQQSFTGISSITHPSICVTTPFVTNSISQLVNNMVMKDVSARIGQLWAIGQLLISCWRYCSAWAKSATSDENSLVILYLFIEYGLFFVYTCNLIQLCFAVFLIVVYMLLLFSCTEEFTKAFPFSSEVKSGH